MIWKGRHTSRCRFGVLVTTLVAIASTNCSTRRIRSVFVSVAPVWVYNQPPVSLGLLFSTGREVSAGQSVLMLCGWGVKADIWFVRSICRCTHCGWQEKTRWILVNTYHVHLSGESQSVYSATLYKCPVYMYSLTYGFNHSLANRHSCSHNHICQKCWINCRMFHPPAYDFCFHLRPDFNEMIPVHRVKIWWASVQ